MSRVDPAHFDAGAASGATEESMLWAELCEAGSDIVRYRLFDRYLPLTKSLARRHFREQGRGDVELHDLIQWGSAGLLEAIDRFDPGRGVPFSAFARKRITGSIRDGLSQASEFRSQMALYRRHRAERMRSLSGERPPARELEESFASFAELVVGLAVGFLIEDGLSEEQARETNGYESLVWQETVEAVRTVVDELPERERFILRGHYEGAMGFDQLARTLGITKGRVSQIHKAALGLLRKRLSRHNPFSFSR